MLESEMFRALRASSERLDVKRAVEFWRLETHGGVLGLADLLYAGRGVGGLIELKGVNETKGLLKMPYRPGQRAFLRRHSRYNPHTYVLVHINKASLYALIGPNTGFPAFYEHGTAELLQATLWSSAGFDDVFFDVIT